jgi:hypothetical protein
MATTEPAAVADMGGEITRGLARSAANTSPEARATLQTFADGRFGEQTDRATEFVRGIIGAKGDIGEATEQIRNAARAANKPAYDAAYAEGDRPIWNPVLEQLSASKSVQSAMRGAESKWSDWAAIDGFGAMNPPARVENGGILKFGGSGLRTFPNIQYWDYVARDLTGKAQAAAEAGNRSEAARFGGLATLVKGQLDKEVPEFQAARTGAAGFFGAQDALEAGQNFVSKSIDINDARRAVAKMSDSDRETFKFGFAGELLNKITGITDRADLTKRIGESQDARDRITLALGNTDAKKMFAFLDAESVMTRLGDAVKGNSSTARQLVELGLAGGTFGLDRSFGSTNDPEAMVKAGLVYGLARGQGKIDQNVVNKVADLLVSKDPRELLRGLNLIADDKALSARIKQMATSVGVRLGAQGGASIPPMMPGTFGTGP